MQEYGPSRRIGHSVERFAASASAARPGGKVAKLLWFFLLQWRGEASSGDHDVEQISDRRVHQTSQAPYATADDGLDDRS